MHSVVYTKGHAQVEPFTIWLCALGRMLHATCSKMKGRLWPDDMGRSRVLCRAHALQ